jgi:KDO2-lipid IV(A) lauroyltransferase
MELATRDVREGGAWSLAQRAKNDALFALASLALGATRGASSERIRAVARRFGGLVFSLAFGTRAKAIRNLLVAFPDMPEHERREIARRAFRNLAAHVAETITTLHTSRARLAPLAFPEASRTILHNALREGRGVVLPSAHLGPWERLAQTIVSCGFPLTAIVRESYDPRFDRLVRDARLRGGLETIARGASGASTRIVRTLKKNGVLGIPMDLATRAESVTAPLFGVPARTAVGAARIAIRTGAPVVVSTVETLPDSDKLAVTCTRLAAARDEIELTARINEELSRRIRALPEHWPWMHDRFASAR